LSKEFGDHKRDQAKELGSKNLKSEILEKLTEESKKKRENQNSLGEKQNGELGIMI